MINLNDKEYFTAKEICEELELSYPTVAYILRKNKFPKYNRQYIISKEQLIELKNRENKTDKLYDITLKKLKEIEEK